jgi:hypothetical protein
MSLISGTGQPPFRRYVSTVIDDTDDLAEIAALLDAGDVGAAVAKLRYVAGRAPLPDVVALVGRAGAAAGFADLASASDAVVADPANAQALYDLGYACVERGISTIAVPVLEAALEWEPGNRTIVSELVAAYEDEYRYRDAVAVLEANNDSLLDWPDRYLIVFNSMMSGDVERARRYAAALSPPDERWTGARRRIDGMLHRAEVVPGPLDYKALRAWHYVLNGTLLASVSPYGFDGPMYGRYAYLQDQADECRRTLARAGSALRTVGRSPSTVSTLPDRSSEILGLAAAMVLDLPAQAWQSGVTDTVVVAYDLQHVDPDLLPGLRERPEGTVLVEHATCWTAPPLVAADLTGLLHQTVVPPWGERLMAPPGKQTYRAAADDRPAGVIAAEIAAATDEPTEVAPGDSDSEFQAFVTALRDEWPLRGGHRDRLWSPGPVSSSFFR